MFVKILGLLRGTLFFSCYLLSIRMVFISIDQAPINRFFICVLELVVGIAGLWKSRMALFGLVGMLPIISGVQMLGFLKPVPLMSLIFSSLFIAWLPKRLFYLREDLTPKTLIGNLVDIFSGLILLSLAITLWRYPIDMIFYHFWYIVPGSQKDLFYCIDAAWVLLQGVFFYRMIELEMNNDFSLRSVLPVFYLQAGAIVFFSVVQFIIRTPDPWRGFALYAPFDDIHSYGSYLALLLFIFLALMGNGPPKARLFRSVSFGSLFLFIALSFSRAAWVSSLIMGFVFFMHKYSARKKVLFLFFSLILFALFWISPLSSILMRSTENYVKRVGQFLSIKELSDDPARIFLWKRGLDIISDFPITGSGIGTFYRISIFYQDFRFEEFKDYYENAHNYFLQLAAELGLPTLIIFLLILLGAYQAGMRTLSSQPRDEDLLKGLVLGFSAYLITCLTGHPLLLANQQFLFWFILSSLVISEVPEARQKCFGHGSMKFSIGISILAFVIAVVTVCDYKNERILSKEQKYEVGFYEYEVYNGRRVRWMGRKAWLRTEVRGNYFQFEVYATPHNLGRDGLLFSLFLNGKEWDTIKFRKGERKSLRYEVPFKEGDFIEIKMAVNKTFNPKRLGLNNDNRNLGVLVSEIKFSDSGTDGPILMLQ